jgi:hypothetical protein
MKPAQNYPDPGLIAEGDVVFRDLNKNGCLDPYEDHRRPISERIEDLLTRMMFHCFIRPA